MSILDCYISRYREEIREERSIPPKQRNYVRIKSLEKDLKYYLSLKDKKVSK